MSAQEIQEGDLVEAIECCSDGYFSKGDRGVAGWQGGCGAWWVNFIQPDGSRDLAPVRPEKLRVVPLGWSSAE